MSGLVLTTFDWVPEMPRGFVRSRPVAGQGLVGRTEQRERVRGDLGRAERFQ